MLVLSRRPSEKILFPGVGISVEIVQTKGNTVRVGIEAPEDVRILRGELQQHQSQRSLLDMNRVELSSQGQNGCEKYDDDQRVQLNQRMEEISLALALAQNQRRQGLSEHADLAIEQAIERVNELKEIFTAPGKTENQAMVCEPSTGYQIHRERKSETRLALSAESFCLQFEFAV